MSFDRVPIILVDMDGVLADYDKKMVEEVNRSKDLDTAVCKENLWSFFYNEDPSDGVHKSYEYIKDKIEWSEGFFYDLEPIDGAIEAVNKMRDLGWDVWLCSSPSVTSDTCHSDKNRWVKKHFGDWLARKMILTKDKTLVYGDILIDDRCHIKGRFADHTAFTHILFEQPYNKESDQYKKGNVIKGWSDNWEEKIREKLLIRNQ